MGRVEKIMAAAYADLEKYNDKPRRRYRRFAITPSVGVAPKANAKPVSKKPIAGYPCRPVVAIERDGKETRYESITEAASAWGVTTNTINNWVRGKASPLKRVLFRYADGEVIVRIRKTRFVAVVAIDAEGNETRYSSLGEAAEATGTHKQTISACLHGRYKTTGGYRWRYDDK
jgi:hypothetical protein